MGTYTFQKVTSEETFLDIFDVEIDTWRITRVCECRPGTCIHPDFTVLKLFLYPAMRE
jgi:hypothetical protein